MKESLRELCITVSVGISINLPPEGLNGLSDEQVGELAAKMVQRALDADLAFINGDVWRESSRVVPEAKYSVDQVVLEEWGD